MKKINHLTLIVGLLLAVVFGLLLFTFQVRQTEVALVTTFGRPVRDIHDPGLYWKWPWPVQNVLKFDKRTQSFEETFEETATQDGRNILITIYLGWSINDPAVFRERFAGSIAEAQKMLRAWSRDAKNAVVGSHPFSHFISTDQEALQFVQIEQEMLGAVQPLAASFGMDVKFLGIKRLALPESVTQNVFERMREERQVEIERLRAAGRRDAANIRSAADRESADILARARAQATELRGKAEAEAAPYYAALEKNRDLALLLLKIEAIETSLRTGNSTLIVTPQTPPFDLFLPAPEAGSHEVDSASEADSAHAPHH